MERLAIESPDPQHLGQVVLQIAGSRKALITHQQPGGLHQLGIARLRAGQQPIHPVTVAGIERMGLLGLAIGIARSGDVDHERGAEGDL